MLYFLGGVYEIGLQWYQYTLQVVQYQLLFILDLGSNMRLIISSIYARMLVWVRGLSYYIMVTSTKKCHKLGAHLYSII